MENFHENTRRVQKRHETAMCEDPVGGFAEGRVNRRRFVYSAAATVSVIAGAALWPTQRGGDGGAETVTTDAIGDKVQRVRQGRLPDFIDGHDVEQVYRYAVEHGDELQYIPCTCGCTRFGHKSNRDCYVKAVHGDGTLTFTSHGAT